MRRFCCGSSADFCGTQRRGDSGFGEERCGCWRDLSHHSADSTARFPPLCFHISHDVPTPCDGVKSQERRDVRKQRAQAGVPGHQWWLKGGRRRYIFMSFTHTACCYLGSCGLWWGWGCTVQSCCTLDVLTPLCFSAVQRARLGFGCEGEVLFDDFNTVGTG